MNLYFTVPAYTPTDERNDATGQQNLTSRKIKLFPLKLFFRKNLLLQA
jgi:hypothetical protein